MENKRVADKKLFSYLAVTDKYTGELLGYLGDISENEIVIIADKPLPPKQIKEVIVTLPNDGSYTKRIVKLQIDTEWSKPDNSNPSLYHIDCYLLNIDPNDLKIFTHHSAPQNFPVIGRRPPRKHLLFYLKVVNQHTKELLGYLGDISKDGIMILAEKPILFNKIKDISIQLPDFEEFSKKSIEACVEIRWMKADANPNLHCIGCHFTRMEPTDLPIIEQVEEILGFED
jgi:hypothetical protein